MASNIGGIVAGGAFVKLMLDSAELNKGLAEAQSRMKRFVAAVNSWGTAVTLNTAVLQAPFKAAFDSFAEFDLKMRQVQAVTSATGQQFQALTTQARKLGRETSFTTDQVSDAMVALGRLGFSAKEVQNSVRPVMNLARATGNSLGDAAMVAGNNMRIFGLETKDMVGITDLITTSVNRSAQTLQDFSEASSKAGPNFVHTGMDIKEMAASLGILANMGIRGSLAGTALSRAIKQLAKGDVQNLLKSYGVEVQDAEKKMRPLHKTLQDIARVMNSMSHAERIRFAEKIFEVRGSLAGLPLTTSAAAIEDFLVQLRNCAGAGEIFATTMEGGVWGAVKLLESAVNDLQIEIGKLFTVSFDGWIRGFTDIINAVTRCSDSWKAFLTPIVQVGGAFMGVGVTLKALVMMGGAIKAIFQPLSALNVWITGAAKNAELAARATELQGLRAAEASARTIAADKARTAAEKRNSAEIAKAHLKEQQTLENTANKNLLNNRRKQGGLNVKVAKARQEYAGRPLENENELSRLMVEGERQEKELSQSKADWREARARADEAGKVVKRLQKQQHSLQTQLVSQQTSLQKGKSYNVFTEGLQQQLEEAQQKAGELRDLVGSAAQEVQSAEQKLFDARKTRDEWVNKEGAHKKRLAKLAQDKKAGVRTAAGMLKMEQARSGNYAQRIENSKVEVLNSKQEFDAKKTTYDSLVTQLKAQDNAVRDLQTKISKRAWRDTDAISESINQTQAELEKTAQELGLATSRSDMATRDREINSRSVRARRGALKKNAQKILSLRKRIDATKARSVAKVAGYQTQVAGLEADEVELKALKAEAEQLRKDAEDEFKQLDREAKRLEEEANKAKAKADEIANNAKSLAYEGGVTEQQKADYTKSLQNEQAAYDERQVANADLTKKKKALAEYEAKHAETRKEAEMRASLWEKDRQEGGRAIAASKQRLAVVEQQHETAVENLDVLKQQAAVEEQGLQDRLKAAVAKRDSLLAEQKPGQEIFAHRRLDSANAEVSEIQSELSMRQLQNQAAIENAQSTVIATEQKISAEKAYQAEMIRSLNLQKAEKNGQISAYGVEESGWNDTASIQKKDGSLVTYKGEFGDHEVTRVASTTVHEKGEGETLRRENADATKNATEKELTYLAAMGKRAKLEKEVLTRSQRWANAWAARSQTMGRAIAFEVKYAAAILKTSIADMVRAKTALYSGQAGKAASGLRVVGYVAEAVAAKTAAAATMLLKTAFDWICANPITAVLLALTGIYALAERAARKAAQAFNEVAEAHRIAYENLKEKNEEMQKEFETSRKYMAYLKSLESATELTADQQNSAIKIIAWLTERYGDLGISVDSLAGKLTGAASAQALLNEKMLEQSRIQTQKRLKEATETASAAGAGVLANASQKSGFWARNFTRDEVSDEWAEVLKKIGYQEEVKQLYRPPAPGVPGSAGHYLVHEWESPVDWSKLENYSTTELKKVKEAVKAGFDFAKSKGLDTSQLETLLSSLSNMITEREKWERLGHKNLTGDEQEFDISNAPGKALEPEDAEKLAKSLEEQERNLQLKKATTIEREIAGIEKERDEYLENVKALKESAEVERNNAIGNQTAYQNRINEANEAVENLNEEIVSLKENTERSADDEEHLKKLQEERAAQLEKITTAARDINTNITNQKTAEDNILKWTQKAAEAKKQYAEMIEEARKNESRRIYDERRDKESLTHAYEGYWSEAHVSKLEESFNKSLTDRYESGLYQQFMQDQDFFGAMKMMVEAMNANKVAMQKATEDYNLLLRYAAGFGYYDGTMNPVQKSEMDAEISRLASVLQEYNSRHLNLRQQYEEAAKAAMSPQERQLQSTGSFSAKALSRSLNADTYYAKVVKIGEGTQLKVTQIQQYVYNLFLQQKQLNARLGIAQ